MNILVINNGTHTPKHILRLLENHHVTIVSAEENYASTLANQYDCTILTGSSHFPIMYNLEKLESEISLIKACEKPLIGICYGCELINIAFGGRLLDLSEAHKVKGIYEIDVYTDHPMFQNQASLKVYEAHRWCIYAVGKDMAVLAGSKYGAEIIAHKHLPIYGFQFHPEKETVTTDGDEIFFRLLEYLQTTY